MEMARVDGVRRTPFPGGRGECTTCNRPVIAKCGPRNRHHWAHAQRFVCDPWWENETDWHRAWKALFPEECREVVHVAPDGEIHRADIKSPSGIYIEVQHSPMTEAERASREAFYGNLVWIIDGRGFRDRFDIFHILPPPDSEVAKDLVWRKAARDLLGACSGMFLRRSDEPQGLLHSLQEIEEEVLAVYCGHHQYDWIRPHSTWLQANCPVYIDFGEKHLVRLEDYGNYRKGCIRYVPRGEFLRDVSTLQSARDIGARRPFREGPLELMRAK